MSFLTGETIQSRILDLIVNSDGTSSSETDRKALESKIDCNSLTLCLGPEAYITGNKPKQKLTLSENQSITIACGQFAILLTEEYISVPKDLFAMISMRSKFKFLGLINVSGFHVDPGWKGRLLFTVFNAGPDDITIARKDPAFLIWFATLDKTSNKTKHIEQMRSNISTDDVNRLNGDEYSPQLLIKRLHKLETYYRWTIPVVLLSILFGIITGVAVDWASYLTRPHLGFEQEINNEQYDKINSTLNEILTKVNSTNN